MVHVPERNTEVTEYSSTDHYLTLADRLVQVNRLHQYRHYRNGQIELCKHIVINSCSCRGYLSKQGTRLKGWNR